MESFFSRASNSIRQNPGRTAIAAGALLALGGLAYAGYRRYRRGQMGPIGPRNAITPGMLQAGRANLRRTDYGVASARYDTFHVRRNVGQSATQFVDFMRATRTAVSTLDSRPVGRAMLQDLNAGVLPDMGFQNNRMVNTNIHFRHNQANTTRHGDMSLYSPAYRGHGMDGPGDVTSRVNWNPDLHQVDGVRRPAFIGMGHELVHSWRAMRGVAVNRNFAPNQNAIRAFMQPLLLRRDELETVGMHATPRHANAPTENRLRAEHGIALRPSYTGVTPATLRATTIHQFANRNRNQQRLLGQLLESRRG